MIFLLFLLIILPEDGSVAIARDSPSELIFGMSTALTGPAAELGENMKTGVLVGFHQTNREGGIRGRQLRLLVLDDEYEPARTAPNIRQLIEQDHVLGFIGNMGTPTAMAALPIINEHHMLFFAPLTGAGLLRKNPPDPTVLNFRASYAEEMSAIIDALITIGQLSPQQIAFFTQRDGYGDAGFSGGVEALKHHGLKNEQQVLHVRYERNSLAVEDALATILLATPLPRAIIMVGTYAPCAKFIQLAREAGINSLFVNLSFVGSYPLAALVGAQESGTLITQVVPHPLETDVPIVQEFRKELYTYDPSRTPTFGSLEGYIAARILVRVLSTMTEPITAQTIIPALKQLGSFDIGLEQPLHLDEKHLQASHHIWVTRLVKGKILPFQWTTLPQILPKPN